MRISPIVNFKYFSKSDKSTNTPKAPIVSNEVSDFYKKSTPYFYPSSFVSFSSLKMRGKTSRNDFCDTSFYRDAGTLTAAVDILEKEFPQGTDIMDFACSNGEEAISTYSLFSPENADKYKFYCYDRYHKVISIANTGIHTIYSRCSSDNFLLKDSASDDGIQNYLKSNFDRLMEPISKPVDFDEEETSVSRLKELFGTKVNYFKLKDEYDDNFSFRVGDINYIQMCEPKKAGAVFFRNAFYIPTKNSDLDGFDLEELFDKTDKKQVINNIVDKIYDKLEPGGILVLGNILKDHVYIAGDQVPASEKTYLRDYCCDIYKKSPLHEALEKDNRFKPVYYTAADKPFDDVQVPTIWQKIS